MPITEEIPNEHQRGYSSIRGQLIILGLFRFSEALAWSTIFPYAFFMMQSFLPSSPSRDAKAAAFASTTVALFTFGEFLMSVVWAKVSDRVGRKPTLMIGVVGGCASALAFGVSRSLGMAMAARAFGGLVNPNVGVISACVGELVERKGDQGRAFSVVPFLRGLGSLVGPVIGGHLADPVKTMPSMFHVGSIWETYPYLLPNLIVALFVAASGILGFFVLEETHPNFRNNGQILRGDITSWIRGMVRALRGQVNDKKYTALSSTEDVIELPSRADAEHAGADEAEPLSPISSQPADTPSPSAWSNQVILQILAVSILAFHKVSSDVIIPIFLAADTVPSKDSSNEHTTNSKSRAGFGMASPSISNILLSQAIVAIIAQVLVVPWAISRWGALKSFRWTLFCFPWLYCLTPFTARLISPFSTSTILLDLWIKVLLVNIGYVASAILVTNTSPAPIHLATINGAAASVSCLARSDHAKPNREDPIKQSKHTAIGTSRTSIQLDEKASNIYSTANIQPQHRHDLSGLPITLPALTPSHQNDCPAPRRILISDPTHIPVPVNPPPPPQPTPLADKPAMENLSLHDHNNGHSHSGRRGGPPSGPHHGQQRGHHHPAPPPHLPAFQHQQQQPTPPPAPGQTPSPTPMMSQGPPQLPPQMFTTAAQLLDLTDKKLVLVLRDGRKLIGVLRSWDQFANLVLQGTVERLYAGKLFADIQRGIYLVRGENVLLLGEVDLDKEDDIPPGYREAPYAEVFELKKKEDSERKTGDKRRSTKLQTLGFEAEHSGEVLF